MQNGAGHTDALDAHNDHHDQAHPAEVRLARMKALADELSSDLQWSEDVSAQQYFTDTLPKLAGILIEGDQAALAYGVIGMEDLVHFLVLCSSSLDRSPAGDLCHLVVIAISAEWPKLSTSPYLARNATPQQVLQAMPRGLASSTAGVYACINMITQPQSQRLASSVSDTKLDEPSQAGSNADSFTDTTDPSCSTPAQVNANLSAGAGSSSTDPPIYLGTVLLWMLWQVWAESDGPEPSKALLQVASERCPEGDHTPAAMYLLYFELMCDSIRASGAHPEWMWHDLQEVLEEYKEWDKFPLHAAGVARVAARHGCGMRLLRTMADSIGRGPLLSYGAFSSIWDGRQKRQARMCVRTAFEMHGVKPHDTWMCAVDQTLAHVLRCPLRKVVERGEHTLQQLMSCTNPATCCTEDVVKRVRLAAQALPQLQSLMAAALAPPESP